MNATYFLRLRGRNVIGSIQLNARTLVAAKLAAELWVKGLKGTEFKLEITNEKGEIEWTL